jgi:hypothetical protein
MTDLPDDIVEVALHDLENQVQISSIVSLDHPLHLHYVLMIELVKDTHLSIGPLGIYIILKCIKDLLQGVLSARLSVDDFPNVTISSTSQKLFDLKCFSDVVLYFFAHCI